MVITTVKRFDKITQQLFSAAGQEKFRILGDHNSVFIPSRFHIYLESLVGVNDNVFMSSFLYFAVWLLAFKILRGVSQTFLNSWSSCLFLLSISDRFRPPANSHLPKLHIQFSIWTRVKSDQTLNFHIIEVKLWTPPYGVARWLSLAAKTENLLFIPQPHMVKGKNRPSTFSSDFHGHDLETGMNTCHKPRYRSENK